MSYNTEEINVLRVFFFEVIQILLYGNVPSVFNNNHSLIYINVKVLSGPHSGAA